MVEFSLIITNYNRAKFLDRAIRSCLNQLLIKQKVEIILIDDCSNDKSKDVYREFANDISIVELKKNRGVANASNIGLKKSSGRYWMRVDSDDYLSMHACALMGQILDFNDDYDYVYCDHIKIAKTVRSQTRVRLDSEDKIYNHGAGILFRKSALKQIGGYDVRLKNAEDYDLLLRLKKNKSKGFYLPIPLYRYYMHGKNISKKPERKFYLDKVKRKNKLD